EGVRGAVRPHDPRGRRRVHGGSEDAALSRAHRARDRQGLARRPLLHAPEARDEDPAPQRGHPHVDPRVLCAHPHRRRGVAEASVVKRHAALIAAVLLFAARAAEACPACTTRSSGGYAIPILLGAMILTPYLVATVVLRVVRKAEAERLEDAR